MSLKAQGSCLSCRSSPVYPPSFLSLEFRVEISGKGSSVKATMSMRGSTTALSGPLQSLGISPLEERAYRALLANRAITGLELAQLLALPLHEIQPILHDLEKNGLTTRSSEPIPRYTASPPELAIEAIISQRQASLEQARSMIPELKEQASAAAHDQEQIVEFLTSHDALAQALRQLKQTVQREAFGFQRAPLLHPGVINKEEMNPGVRVRSISDSSYLAIPGSLEGLRMDIKRGEEARTITHLPIKMFVVDKRIGVIPLHTDNEDGPHLLLRSSALLDALCALFELVWEQATPIVISRSGELEAAASPPRLSEAAGQLLPLLAAGLNDKAIAYQAGISPATLNRRIAELMKSSGTRTRFQLGWRIALDSHPSDA
jgi:predicted transcriptional regulator/DNA-binding CsgD family transcriptional regulator